MDIALEAGEYYFDVQGKLRGPLVEDVGIFGLSDAPHLWQSSGQPVIPGSVGRLITHVMVIPIPSDAEGQIDDDLGHLLEAMDQWGTGGHDMDRNMVWFTEKQFREFCEITSIIGDPLKRILGGLNKYAYKRGQQLKLIVEPETPFATWMQSTDPKNFKSDYAGHMWRPGGWTDSPLKEILKQQTFDDVTLGKSVMGAAFAASIEPPKFETKTLPKLEKFQQEMVRKIAERFGVSYEMLTEDYTRTHAAEEYAKLREAINNVVTTFARANSSINEVFRNISNRFLKDWWASYMLPVGPGINRKGRPHVGSVWKPRARGDNSRVVVIESRWDDERRTEVVVTREDVGTAVGDMAQSLINTVPMIHWIREYRFVRVDIETPKRLLYSQDHRPIPKRVGFAPYDARFYRRSASGKNHYPLSGEFAKAWWSRRNEFPITTPWEQKLPPEQVKATVKIDDINPENIKKAFGASGGIVTPKARLVFNSVELKKSDNDHWHVCGVAGRDLKAGMVVSIKDGVVMPSKADDAESKVSPTKATAEMNTAKEEPTKYTVSMKIDKRDADLAKLVEAVEEARKTKLVPALPTVTLHGPPIPAWFKAFIDHIGDFNGLGKAVGVWQKTSNSVTVQYRSFHGMRHDIEVMLPPGFVIPMIP